MMPDGSVSQATRLGKFISPLGNDALVLIRFQGEEGVNSLGSFRVEVMSSGTAIDLDSLLGLHGTVAIQTLQHGLRHYDGIITEAEVIGERKGDWIYTLTLRPWFWLTGLRQNQRIFHNRTAPQIIATVLGEHAFTNEPRLSKSYDPIEYVVQYGESDLAFVCRMMERAGISYHFEHAQGTHKMVLTDAMEGFTPAPGGSRIFEPVEGQHRATEEHFNLFAAGRQITTGRVKLTDYNFKTPTAAMVTEHAGNAAHAMGQIESYRYPGVYLAQGEGRGVVRLRTDQVRSADGLFRARGDTASLSPGMLVGLKNHPDSALNGKDYLLISAAHSYVSEGYKSGGDTDEPGDSYAGEYGFHPQAQPFAPAIVTPFARVQGPQTAVVVGEGEIDCDAFGRILVRFHWDLNAEISMRCRVSQNWAGNGWGGMVIPRIGMEVLVEFLEGDPDKPLVTGCVYNGRNKVPYPLPANKTVSTFKTDTHQGTGFNEVRFEDEKAREEIFIHAQKDRNEKTLNNHSERIDNNWLQSVGHNKSIEVQNNHVEAIGGNLSISVGPSGIGQVVSALFTGLTGGLGAVADALGLKGLLQPGEGNMSLSVEKAKSEIVGTVSATTVGIAHYLTAGTSIEMTSGKTMGITVGKRATESVGQDKTIDVGDSFTMICGKSRITMKKDGTVTIEGKDIMLKASGKIISKASGDVIVKGAKISHN